MTVRYCKTITGCEHQTIRKTISEMMACIKECTELDKENEYEFCLILNELIANGTIHGNKGLCTKSITAKIESVDNNVIRITIKDEGAGFNYKEIFRAICQKKCDCYSERGRGLRLIKAFCDEISFNDIGNEVSILKSVNKPE
ncbi:MAG TPA: ATP-binding protein [Candidatus Atribacteria bacterium]|nr:ATP-binding protein [Candidatus Atribacteria bacterium]HPT79392.1 ATP-binding protein [Candidatus Atribacteria bacterium]